MSGTTPAATRIAGDTASAEPAMVANQIRIAAAEADVITDPEQNGPRATHARFSISCLDPAYRQRHSG